MVHSPLLLLLLSALLATTTGFKCAECGTYECTEPSETECKWGKVLDSCNCCMTCGRELGKQCGAKFLGSPKCGRCLTCVKPPLKPGEAAFNQWGKCELNCTEAECLKNPMPDCPTYRETTETETTEATEATETETVHYPNFANAQRLPMPLMGIFFVSAVPHLTLAVSFLR